MPEAKRMVLNVLALRARAMVSAPELASRLGVSATIIYKLETGKGNPRLNSVLRIALELGVLLHTRPRDVLRELIPPETLSAVNDVYTRSKDLLGKPRSYKGSYRAKRRFLQQATAADEVERDANEISLVRLQELFARTFFTRTDLSDLTGISTRRLGDLFDLNASNTGSLALWTFLRLAAALAPARESTVEETIFYILEDDLERLDQLYEERHHDHPGGR